MTADTLDTAEKISRIFSIVAIPLVLGIGGWLLQRRLQDQSTRRDYVKLALTILQSKDVSKMPPEIREWAVDLLSENSPTKLNARAIEGLKSGSVTLPTFNFVSDGSLPDEMKQTLAAALQDFKRYLVNLGFSVPPGRVSVNVSPGSIVERGNNRGVAFWDPGTHSILVASAFASDRVAVLRQFSHALLAPAGKYPADYVAIKSGAASYFPCSFTHHPLLGDEASEEGKAILPPQDLRRRRPLSEIELEDWTSVQNDGSEIWGGVFWEIRQLLGQETGDRLIADTWRGLVPGSNKGEAYASFVNDFLTNAAAIDGGKYTGRIRAVFEGRGLRL